MVDFHEEDISLYIPRNLSNEKDYHERVASQIFEALKESRTSVDNTAMEENVENGTGGSGTATEDTEVSSDATTFYLPKNTRTAEGHGQGPKPDSDKRVSDLSCYLTELTMASSSPGAELSSTSDRSSISTVGDANDRPDDSDEPVGKQKPDMKLHLTPATDANDDNWTDTPSVTPDSPEKPVELASQSPFHEDCEFDFLRAEPVKRSTSLKTYKTPPGTPRRKKGVRFADALGLDLESVRHILNIDEPPKVPASAMKHLKQGLEEEKQTEGVRYLSINFPQPGASPTFFQRVQAQKILLENCIVDDKNLTITGTVRVSNISYHKKVIVRYTVNNWLTSTDIIACYVQNSNDGPSDRFSFSISVPQYFSVGSRVQFCLEYIANGMEFWDSNYGGNYIVECYAKAISISEKDNAWIHFL